MYRYTDILNMHDSIQGLVILGFIFILIAHYRPLFALAFICIYPNMAWAGSYNLGQPVNSFYFLAGFLIWRYKKKIVLSIKKGYYDVTIKLATIIILWSLTSQFFYPVQDGLPAALIYNLSFERGVLNLVILLLLPALITSRAILTDFLWSLSIVLITMHILLIPASLFFVLLGNSVANLNKMMLLDTPPIYWESGLLLITTSYLILLRKFKMAQLLPFFFLGIIGLIFGNSRARFISSAVCILYFLYPIISQRLLFCGVLFLCIFGITIPFAPQNITTKFNVLLEERYNQTMHAEGLEDMSSGRNIMYQNAIDRWSKAPILGVGSCYIMKPRLNWNHKLYRKRVHNYYLEVLAGQGIIGASFLIIILSVTSGRIFRIYKKKTSKIETRLIVSLLLYGLINWIFKESWGITYSIIALINIYYRLIKWDSFKKTNFINGPTKHHQKYT